MARGPTLADLYSPAREAARRQAKARTLDEIGRRNVDATNRERFALAVASDLEQELGRELTSEEMAEVMNRAYTAGSGGDLDLQVSEEPSQFENVEGRADTVPNTPRGIVDTIVDTGREIASTRRIGVAQQELSDIRAEENRTYPAKSFLQAILGDGGERLLTTPVEELISPTRHKEAQEERQREIEARRAAAQQVIAEEAPRLQSIEERLGGSSRVGRVVGGILAQPEQALPIVGGFVGSIAGPAGSAFGAAVGSAPMAQSAYNSAYTEALDQFGATEEEAEAYAQVMAGIEFGTEAIGGKIASAAMGRLGISRLTKDAAREGLAKVIRSRTARIAGAAAAEGVGEAATEGLQDLARETAEATNAFESPEARRRLAEFNAAQAETRLTRVLDAAAGGALVGGGVSAVGSPIAYAYEQGKQQAATVDAAAEAFRGEQSQVQRRQEQARAEEAEARAAEETRAAQQRAFEQAEVERQEQERQAAAQRENEIEAEFRNKELQEKAAQNPDSPIAQAMARGVVWTPEAIAEEKAAGVAREQAAQQKAAQEEAERLQRAEQGKNLELLRKKREEAAKKAENDRKTLERSRTSTIEAERRKIADQILSDNPNISDSDFVKLVDERLQPVRERVNSPDFKPQSAKTETPAAPKKAPAKKATKKAVPEPAPSLEITPEQEIRNTLKNMGINMDMATPASRTEESDNPEQYRERLTRMVKGLGSRNDQQSTDVQNLMRQGKLIVAPNAKSLGREETNSAAEYDPQQGKMYLYLDKTDPDDTTATIIRAVHESTHAGQMNPRRNRDTILSDVLGKDIADSSVQKIRAAANSNTFAREAVERAAEARETYSKRYPNLTKDELDKMERMELTAYFAGAVAEARGSTLGRMRGVAADMVTGAKSFLRKAGVPMDVTIGDIASLSQQAISEMVRTDVVGRDGNPLDMIGGRGAAGFNRAQQQGRDYRGFVDKLERFEFSDADSTIHDFGGNLDELLDQQVLKLPEVMGHTRLYEEYPALSDYNIAADYDLSGTLVDGYFDATTKSIFVNPRLVGNAIEGRPEGLRSVLLHEAQHAIQDIEGFVPGTNIEGFLPADIKFAKSKVDNDIDMFLSGVDLPAVVVTLPEASQRTWANEKKALEFRTDEAEKRYFMDEGYMEDSSNPRYKRAAERYKNLKERKEKVDAEHKEALTKAEQLYIRDYGEAEARNTQFRRNMTDEERRSSPPESTMVDAEYNVPVEETIDSTPYTGGRGLENISLSMADGGRQAVARVRQQSKIPTIIKSLLSSGRGTGRQINEIIEHAQSSPAAQRMLAEGYVGKYNNALAKEAGKKGVTKDQLTKDIIKTLDSIDTKTDDYKTNLAAYKQALKPFGEVGRVLGEFRDLVDQMSLDIIKQRLNSGIDLTNDEAKVYNAIAANLGRYAHRQYASMLKDAGRTYANRVWDAYEKAKQGEKKLSPQEQENAKRAYNAIKTLVDQIHIPSTEEMADMNLDDLRRLYNVWGTRKDRDALTREQMILELEQSRNAINGDSDVLTRQAETIAQEILGLIGGDTPSLLASYYRGGKQDRGILQSRQKINPAIRELMGEIKDPAMRMFATAAKQAEFVAKTKMLLEISRVDNPYHVQPPGPSGRPEVKGMTELSGESYGPLRNYWVSPELFNALSDVSEQLATFEQAAAMAANRPEALPRRAAVAALNAWGNIAATTKMMSILGNPMRFAWNFLGSFQGAVINGNYNPVHYAKAFKTAADVIRYSRNPTKGSEEARRVNALGITDSAFIGEIKSELYRDMVKEVDAMTKGRPENFRSKMLEWSVDQIRKGALTWKEAYAMMDVWIKFANFYQQVDVLSDYYKAAGVKKSAEEIDREAADITNRTNITFKRVAPIIKATERGGLSMFGPYMYDVFRTQVNNVRQGFEEIGRAQSAPNTKAANVMRAQAIKRLSGQSAYWTAMGLASKLANEALFDDDDERDKLRFVLPDFLRANDFISVGKTKDGKEVVMQLDAVDMNGPITDLMRFAMNDPDMTPDKIAESIVDVYIAPRVGAKVIDALRVSLGDPGNVQEPLVRQWFPEAYNEVSQTIADYTPISQRTTRAWMNALETAYPGILRTWSSNAARPQASEALSVEGLALATSYLGNRLYSLDGEKALIGPMIEYKEGVSARRKEIEYYVLDSGNDPDPTRIGKKVAELIQEDRLQYNLARNTYLGALQAGLSEEEAAGVIKKFAPSKAAASDVISGEFKPLSISEKSFNSYKSKNLEKITDEKERKKAEQKWDTVWELLSKEVEEYDVR